VFGVTPEMKWPNDLLVDDAKVAGILAQGGTDFVVVGIGVNIGWAPEGAARLAVDDEFGPLDLLRAMLPKIERLESMSTTELRDEYVRHLSTIGRRVRVAMIDGGSLEGVARGVDDDARLEVTLDDGTIARVEVGDVIHLRT
jgi:BirA family biotin operon repressor/biotin-[acetyl-CoA-carboxylase] ligase